MRITAGRILAILGVALPLVASVSTPQGAPQASQEPDPRSPVVLVAEVDGIIHPVTAEFMGNAIDRADTAGAIALVFELRTPGGLVESTRTIISRMIAARTPIVIFVGPSGARAASAGFYMTLAADVAVMAPGTHIGAAHPATIGSSGEQQQGSRTMEEKAASDLAAYARSLAEARGRNIALSNEAVRKSRSFTEREALEATPPLIDFIASNSTDVIRQLDDRTIRRFNGAETTLRTAGARVEHIAPTWRQRFLSAIAHPQIAVLLFSLGMLGLTVELWYPGTFFPGVVGGLCLLMAFLAFQVLPIDVTGLLLIVLGLGLLVLELNVPSFGVLGIGGIVSLILGWIVMMGNVPDVAVSLSLIVPVTVAFGAIFLFLGRLALAAQRQASVTGTSGMLGLHGRAITDIQAGGTGQISVRGEIWSATASEPIPRDARVEVVAVDGLTLTIRPLDRSFPGGSRS
ncbi:MAG: nodulation protein NfeD [Luteitalea sp.]|nr:nodulation protein NfeD [Luteitalea sp.]